MKCPQLSIALCWGLILSVSAEPPTPAIAVSKGSWVPLFDEKTPLMPETTVDTPQARITRIGDRARDRHAREGMFHAYDHYLTWYWEERTMAIEIVDEVAKGGTEVIFNYTTLAPLGAPEFRAFYRGINTVAEYHFNLLAPLTGPNRYTAKISQQMPENRPLRIGDRIEFEISQFLQAPKNGRSNYYGTTMLYIVGQGVVPWLAEGTLLDSAPLPQSAWMGGATTLPYQYSDEPEDRFKQMAGNIAPENAQPFLFGRRLHHTDFGNGTHSEPGNPVFDAHAGKLGPLFTARSCVECHTQNGRSLPPEIGAPMTHSVTQVAANAAGAPHPVLGKVLQPLAVSGAPEGSAAISRYLETAGTYADGTAFSLRRPEYVFEGKTVDHFSVRLAPPLVGLGLLEAIDETTIFALADPDDANGDGISGKARRVTDPETGEARLGRFTAKAGEARLRHQIAAALDNDMGVTTSIFPGKDAKPELSDSELEEMTRYVSLLGVAARRDLGDPQVARGAQVFEAAKCAACHVPELATGRFHPLAELRNQTIRPFTDLLLHDMGPGLADTLGEPGANGSEWRTPPLWSIGLTAGVSGGEAYLHDGRARSIAEAILWHGGEAEASREHYRKLPQVDRAALEAYVKSL
ncbi:MAG: di-heme oxidoredictase family protein [Verrucomicrobiota bacterium]